MVGGREDTVLIYDFNISRMHATHTTIRKRRGDSYVANYVGYGIR